MASWRCSVDGSPAERSVPVSSASSRATGRWVLKHSSSAVPPGAAPRQREMTESVSAVEVRSRFGYFVKPLSNRQMVGWSSEVLDGLNRIAGDVPVELCANIGVVCARP